MSTAQSIASLPSGLADWVASVTGSPLTDARELTGGASRTSYVVTSGDGRQHFLRVDTGKGPLSGTPFTLEREFGILSHLQGRGLPIVKVHGHSRQHDAMLMEHVAGYTSYERMGTEAEEARLRRDLVAAVVELQKLDTRPMTFLGDYCGESLCVAIPADLAIWRRLYRERVKVRDPLVEFSLHWLEQALPDAKGRAVLVHGDAGPGNFMINDGRLTALIDWELVRVGHPLEDVACIIARALGAPFGAAQEHIRNYEELTGTRVEAAELDYALALILTRWLIGIQMALSRPSAQQNVPMLFAFRQLNAHALVQALERRYGATVDSPDVRPSNSGSCPVVFTYVRDYLRTFAGGGAVAAADSYKLNGVVDLVEFLQCYVDYGPERHEREFVDRVGACLSTSFTSGDEANRALCDHAATVAVDGARPVVELLGWWYARELAIMRTSLRERADRRIDL